MTVAELIVELQACDPAALVVIPRGDCDDLEAPGIDKIWVDPRGPFAVKADDRRAVPAVSL